VLKRGSDETGWHETCVIFRPKLASATKGSSEHDAIGQRR
jgi:hypothetical protein